MSKFEIIERKTGKVLEVKEVRKATAFMSYFYSQCDTNRFKFNQIE